VRRASEFSHGLGQTATLTYVRDPAGWVELVCAESRQWYSGKDADVPRADKPDF